MENYTTLDPEKIAATFRAFGENECKGASDLYYQLVYQIADDNYLTELAAHVVYGQPIPNSFLASIHYLLLSDPTHELAAYYPTISSKMAKEIPFQLFKDFCRANEKSILQLISTRLVQTNVIGRCAYLAAIFSKLIAAEPDRDVTIIDIGTSAGLTQNWDKYEYHFSNGLIVGNSTAKAVCELRGGQLDSFSLPTKSIRKIGLDQNIIDPTRPEDARWLRALIWPDMLERYEALNEALKIEDLSKIEFRQASTVNDFKQVISGVSKADLLIVYCTHAMYQFPMEMRVEFWDMLDEVGSRRDLYFLSSEGIKAQIEKYNTANTVVELTSYQSGNKTQKLMAEVNSHGRWMIWHG